MGLINYKVIANVLGSLLGINGLLMLLSLPFSLYYGESLWPIAISAVVTGGVGCGLFFATRDYKEAEIKKRDGYLIVSLGWLIMVLFGTLPYLLSGSIQSVTDSFFESMSGFSTTGASILNDIEALPKGVLFWRSMTQWIGGLGIIVLTVAILPLLGIGGMELFVAEAPGPTKDKIHPRIKETAKRLWVIYVSLTLLETVILMFCGMSFFDAINHSLTTLSTGGFSTKQDSIAHFASPLIEAVIIVFMFVAGTNFTLIYFAFMGRMRKIWSNDEFRWYALWILIVLALSVPAMIISGGTFGKSFRDALFQIVSITTTTGFVTADYTAWAPFLTMLFFIMLFTGASAGSTSGGIKLVRIALLMKNGFTEFKRRIHPHAIIPVYLNKESVSSQVIYNLLAFIFLYILIFVVSSVVLSVVGLDFMTAVGAVATSLGNVGPGIGDVGPVNNFAQIPVFGKWFLSFLMLLGRLELFTVLVIFSPYFWRKA